MASVIVIKVDGVDITEDVIFADAEFNSQASGSPGACKFRLKDMEYAYEFVVGQTITLDVDDERVWGGWIQSIQRQYFFPYASSPGQRLAVPVHPNFPCGTPEDLVPIAVVPRALVIEGVDYNILFRKRFCFNKSGNLADANLKSWPPGTSDRKMIEYLCSENLDLSGDGLDYNTLVETVGQPNPDAKGNPAGAGWSWEDAMKAISRYPGSIFYIDPDRKLVYTDVDTPNAEYKLTDTPGAPDELGYRDMEILYNGANLVNDAMVWGAGQGARRVKFRRTRDQASIDAHGLWQVGDFRGDLWRQTSVDKRSRSFVYGSPQNKRGGREDAVSVSVSLFTPTFRVAQKVDFKSNVFGFADVLPIRRMKITFPTPVEARFDLILSHAIDEPWNTFEYWFPKIKLPQIVIPNVTFAFCPVPDLAAPSFPPLAGLIPLFSDDFARESGQPNSGRCGVWFDFVSGIPRDPPITPDGMDLFRSSNTDSRSAIALKTPITGAYVVLLAVDPRGWSSGGELNFYSYPGSEISVYLRALHNEGTAGVGSYHPGASGGTGSSVTRKNLYRTLTAPFFVRIVYSPETGVFLKVWPQNRVEPFNWTVTHVLDADNQQDYPYFDWEPALIDSATQLFFIYGGWSTSYLQGISIWGYGAPTPKKIPIMGWGLAGRADGWQKSFYCEPPDLTERLYGGSWGEDSVAQGSKRASQYIEVRWGYYWWDYGPGFVSKAESNLSPFYVWDFGMYGVHSPDPLIGSWYRISRPSSVTVKGKVTVSLNQSLGVGGIGANRVPQTRVIGVAIYAQTNSRQPYWIGADSELTLVTEEGASPSGVHVAQWSPLDYGGPIWWGSTWVVANGGSESSVTLDWEGQIKVTTEDWPSSSGFSLSVSLFDPFGVMRTLDPSGGPFMMPNEAMMKADVWIDDDWISATYGLVKCGSHFCVTGRGGDETSGERRCDVIAIDKDSLQATIDSGENWAITLRSGYLPGSVVVFVDGQPVRPALDYIELDSLVGTIAFLNNFVNAAMIEVCYFPDTGA